MEKKPTIMNSRRSPLLPNYPYSRPIEVVTLVINDPLRMFWRLLLDAKMGLGESFMLGYWDASPNPTHFLNLLIRSKSLFFPRFCHHLFNRE